MLMRTDPFRELDRLSGELLGSRTRPAAMPMDAYREGDNFRIDLELPGIDPNSIDLTVEQNVLSIHAERQPAWPEGAERLVSERAYGTFSRQVFLGETLDVDNLSANYDSGVLTIEIPVAEQAKPRKVEVTSSGDNKQINA